MIKLNETTLLNNIEKIKQELQSSKINSSNILELLQEHEQYIQNEIYVQCNISNSNNKSIKAFQRLATKFNKNKIRKSMNGAYNHNNCTYLCNNYYMIKSNEIIPCTERDDKDSDYPCHILSLIDDTIINNNICNSIKLDKKDIVQKYKLFKACKKKATIENHGIYSIEYGEYITYVSIEYLYSIAKIIDIDNAICTISTSSTNPITISDSNFQSLLAPIRIN